MRSSVEWMPPVSDGSNDQEMVVDKASIRAAADAVDKAAAHAVDKSTQLENLFYYGHIYNENGFQMQPPEECRDYGCTDMGTGVEPTAVLVNNTVNKGPKVVEIISAELQKYANGLRAMLDSIDQSEGQTIESVFTLVRAPAGRAGVPPAGARPE